MSRGATLAYPDKTDDDTDTTGRTPPGFRARVSKRCRCVSMGRDISSVVFRYATASYRYMFEGSDGSADHPPEALDDPVRPDRLPARHRLGQHRPQRRPQDH